MNVLKEFIFSSSVQAVSFHIPTRSNLVSSFGVRFKETEK